MTTVNVQTDDISSNVAQDAAGFRPSCFCIVVVDPKAWSRYELGRYTLTYLEALHLVEVHLDLELGYWLS